MEVIKIEKKINYEEQRVKRVAAYVRVSTECEQSLHSFESQCQYFESKIKNTSGWIFAGIYSDSAKSGCNTTNRKNFLKMMIDADNEKFDLIVTKSISRFARNTIDVLKYIRFLKERNIYVIFEEENLNTKYYNSEFVISILASIAQQEIINVSWSIRYGQAIMMKQGFAIGVHNLLGYNYDYKTRTFTIIHSEAMIVRKIFKLYLDGNGVEKIKFILEDEKVPTKTGNKIWNASVILKMLRQEKYNGDLILGKKCTVGSFDNKRIVKNTGQRDMFIIRNDHQAIISKEDFDKVQELLKEHHKISLTKNDGAHNRYCYSGKVRCGFCFNTVIRKQNKVYNNPYLRCANLKKCDESKSLKESVLKLLWLEAINKFKETKIKYNHYLVNDKLKYFKKQILLYETKDFNENLFKKCVHAIILGRTINETSEPFSVRFILKSNSLLNSYPTSSEVQSHEYFTLLEYYSNTKMNYRIHETNILYEIDKIYVSLELDLTGDN